MNGFKFVKQNNNYVFYVCFFVISLFFLSIYILSFSKIVNFWSFSQAHISYSEGFIKRGLFGSLMFFFEKNLNISPRNFFSIFHIFFYSLNIFLFFNLIKKYLSNKLLFIFLAFCPSLILFSFNDLGGYQRLDVLSVACILVHSTIADLYYQKKINKIYYNNVLILFLFPIILISIFFHEIQIFSLPFHFFVSYGIFNKKFIATFKKYIIFIIPVFCVLFIYPDEASIIKLSKNIEQREIWSSAFLFHSKNLELNHYLNEIKINILTPYNFKIHLMMIFFSTMPFLMTLYFLNRRALLIGSDKTNLFISVFIAVPFLTGLVIGDFGRWVNLMSFSVFGYLSQFPLRKKLKDFKIQNKNAYYFFSNILILLIVIFYILSVRIPHCCNLKEKNLTLFGGIIDKSIAISHVVFDLSDKKKYDLDKRFK